MTKPVERVSPRRIPGWTIEATCPACGDILAHQADGRPSGGESRALARCTGCTRTWLAEITIREATNRPVTGPGGRTSHPPGCACAPCQQRNAA